MLGGGLARVNVIWLLCYVCYLHILIFNALLCLCLKEFSVLGGYRCGGVEHVLGLRTC